ncbi:MAG: SDR family NAD(P)-dependent oxidoreductase, partial [Anaerolineae bacterium]|nr:SDR family NAD(P)-dependent oxidoreductase [Anaerolineae bacterium]
GPAPGDAPRAAYLAAKAGVLAFTAAAAEELSPLNILVNAVIPASGDLAAAAKAGLELCTGGKSGEIREC